MIHATWLDLIATPVLGAVLWAIARIDLDSFRIPDRLVLPLIGLGLALALWRGALWDSALGAALGYGVFAGIGAWIYRRRGVDALGLGDAKLLAASGAWLGWMALPWVVLMAAGGGLVFVVLCGWFRGGGALRGTAIAFGPWLAAAFFGLWAVFLVQAG